MSFVKQTLGTKWYSGTNPQEAMFHNAKQNNHKACLVKIDIDGHRSYGSYISWDEAIDHLQTLNDNVRKQHFELLPEDKPCKPYFDFDYRYDNKSTIKHGDIDIPAFSISVENSLRTVLQNLTGFSPSSPALNNCFIWTDSSSAAKFSLHLVIHLALENDQGMRELWLCSNTERAKYFCIEMLRLSPDLAKFSDTKVYTRNRTMRMCGSSKHGKEEKLQLLDLPLTKENLMKTTITWFEQSSKLFPIINDELIKTESKITSYKEVDRICAIDDADYEKLAKFIEEIKMQANLVSSIKLIRGNIDTITIGLKTRWCPNIKREHSSQHQYAVLSKHGLVFKCQDAECVDFKFGKISFKSLPADVRALCVKYLDIHSSAPAKDKKESSCQYINKMTEGETEMSSIINEDLKLENNPNWRLEQVTKKLSSLQNKWFRENDTTCLVDPSYTHAHPGQCGIECKKHKLLLGCSVNGHMDKSREFKRWLDHIPHCIEKHKMEIEVHVKTTTTDASATELAQLVDDMYNLAKAKNYRRSNGCIYGLLDGKQSVYVQLMSYKEWLVKDFQDDSRLLADPGRQVKLIQSLNNIGTSRMPFIERDYRYIGFKNGILYLPNSSFILYDNISEDIVVRHYIDQILDIKHLSTPSWDTVFEYQIEKEDVDGSKVPDREAIEAFCGLLGRLMYPLKAMDNLTVAPMIFGASYTGKSTIVSTIMKCFDSQQVACINAKMEDHFGLEGVFDREVLIAPDMPLHIHKKIDKTDMQSMISGELVLVPRKGLAAHQGLWTVPWFMVGNRQPSWYDEGGASVSQRWVFAQFNKKVKKNISGLAELLEKELPAIIYKNNQAYLRLYGNEAKKSTDFWEECPEYFKRQRLLFEKSSNKLLAFLRQDGDENTFYRVADSIVKWKDFKSLLDQNNFKKVSSDAIEFSMAGLEVTHVNFCKSCQKKAAKDCCSYSSPTNRTKLLAIMNISIVVKE